MFFPINVARLWTVRAGLIASATVQLRDYQRCLANLPFGKRLPNAIYRILALRPVGGSDRFTYPNATKRPSLADRRDSNAAQVLKCCVVMVGVA
jgi:hypothetical protein